MGSSRVLNREAKKWLEKKKTGISGNKDSLNNLKRELENIEKEEKRYIKAFGQGAINMRQLKDATSSLGDRRTSMESQILKLSENSDEYKIPSTNEIEIFCDKVKKLLKNLSFEIKRKIVVELVDKIVATQKELIVSGVIPVCDVEYVDEWSISRNSWSPKCGEEHII